MGTRVTWGSTLVDWQSKRISFWAERRCGVQRAWRSSVTPVRRRIATLVTCRSHLRRAVGNSRNRTPNAYAALSARTVDEVLRPFLAGVFLDPLLSTDARVFHLIWRCFLRGGGAVPTEGMSALPQQLAGDLVEATIRTGAEVSVIEGTRVRLLGGETISARGGRRHGRQYGRAAVARGRTTELARCHHVLLRGAALTSVLAHVACRWTQRPLTEYRRPQRCRGAVRAAGGLARHCRTS